MKAYQVVQFGAPIRERIVPDPVPKGAEVLVDVVTCGLCHSDAHFHKGHFNLGGDATLSVEDIGIHLPATLGHEIFGRVAGFGPGAGLSPSDIGQAVVVYPWIGCGTCPACLAERDNECPAPRSIGMQVPGGHGAKVLVRERKYLLPADGMDQAEAGILACCGLTAFAALEKLPRRDGWIGIIGLGGLGLMALSIEKGLRSSRVAAFDIDASKLELAREEYAADFVVDSKSSEDIERARSHTQGLIGMVDFVGSPQTLELGLSLLRNGGTYVNVGLFGATLQMPLTVLASRQYSLRGSYTGTLAELRMLMEHARAGRFKPIPTELAPIASINEGLGELRAGHVVGRIVHGHSA